MAAFTAQCHERPNRGTGLGGGGDGAESVQLPPRRLAPHPARARALAIAIAELARVIFVGGEGATGGSAARTSTILRAVGAAGLRLPLPYILSAGTGGWSGVGHTERLGPPRDLSVFYRPPRPPWDLYTVLYSTPPPRQPRATPFRQAGYPSISGRGPQMPVGWVLFQARLRQHSAAQDSMRTCRESRASWHHRVGVSDGRCG